MVWGIVKLSVLTLPETQQSMLQQSIHIERVHIDGKLLENVLPTAKHFFKHCILPEILSKCIHISSIAIPSIDSDNREADDEDDGSWCYCKEDIAGEMIACDNKTCPNTWYHLVCLKMTTAPKGKWFCPSCLASSYHLKRSHAKILTQVMAPNNKRMKK